MCTQKGTAWQLLLGSRYEDDHDCLGISPPHDACHQQHASVLPGIQPIYKFMWPAGQVFVARGHLSGPSALQGKRFL